jgi:hypothetical protein
MSFDAVLAYIEEAGVAEGETAEAVAERAREGGASFVADELRVVLEVRRLLLRARQDTDVRERVRGAESPLRELAASAADLGLRLHADDLVAVLTAARARAGELDDAALEGVAGGTFFRPELADEVIVGFVQGDSGAPVVLGAFWNGKDAPPRS